MKGQFKIYKNMVRKAVDEGLGEFTSCDLAVLNQMSGIDGNNAAEQGKLPFDRIQQLAISTKCSRAIVEKVVGDFISWTRKLGGQELSKFGITAKQIDDGTEELEFREFD